MMPEQRLLLMIYDYCEKLKWRDQALKAGKNRSLFYNAESCCIHNKVTSCSSFWAQQVSCFICGHGWLIVLLVMIFK